MHKLTMAVAIMALSAAVHPCEAAVRRPAPAAREISADLLKQLIKELSAVDVGRRLAAIEHLGSCGAAAAPAVATAVEAALRNSQDLVRRRAATALARIGKGTDSAWICALGAEGSDLATRILAARPLATGDAAGLRAMYLPGSVAISTEPRPAHSADYGQDINLPFLKSTFAPDVLSTRKDNESCWLLRTGSTALGFVATPTEGWKVYRVFDTPVE